MEQNRIKERLLKMYRLATYGVDGKIKTATITGVLFTDFPYQYKLIDAESNVLFRDKDNVFDTVEKAIKDLVLRYTERLAAQYDADLAKI